VIQGDAAALEAEARRMWREWDAAQGQRETDVVEGEFEEGE